MTGSYRFRLNNSALNTNHTAAHHLVSLAGVIQKPNTGTAQPSSGYAINGNDIVFSSPPLTGTGIFITTIGSALSIGEPSDNTVTSAKIVDGSIVNGDINDNADIALSKLDTTNTASSSNFLRGDGAWAGAAPKKHLAGKLAVGGPRKKRNKTKTI